MPITIVISITISDESDNNDYCSNDYHQCINCFYYYSLIVNTQKTLRNPPPDEPVWQCDIIDITY